MVRSYLHLTYMFSCLTIFPMVYEVLTAVALCKAVPSLVLNLMVLIDEMIAKKVRQLPVEGLLLPYLYV